VETGRSSRSAPVTSRPSRVVWSATGCRGGSRRARRGFARDAAGLRVNVRRNDLLLAAPQEPRYERNQQREED
jgi:hypothetical protein